MKNKLSLIYKMIIIILSGIGVYLNFQIFTVKGALIYYTVQSTLFCFLFYLSIMFLNLIGKLKYNSWYYILKGAVTMSLLITMVVYQLFLSNTNAYAGNEMTSVLVHLIIPLLVIFDYLIFSNKGNLKKSHPYMWSLTLVFYLIFYVIYALMGGKFNNQSNYPYFFLNVEEYGVIGVFINCIIIYGLFLIVGNSIQVLDQKLKKRMLSRGK